MLSPVLRAGVVSIVSIHIVEEVSSSTTNQGWPGIQLRPNTDSTKKEADNCAKTI